MKILIWIVIIIIAAIILTVMSEFGHFNAISATIIVVLITPVAGSICMFWDNRSSIFRRSIGPSCSYCHHGVSLGFDEVACTKRGIMTEAGRCGAFRYEPTKRKPEYAHNPVPMKIAEEDFRI